MKKIVPIIMAIALAISLTGCQSVAKNFGGTTYVDIPKGNKLLEVTWKDDSLWYLYRPMREDESAEEYVFQQQSNLGVIEGKVILKEAE